MATAFALFKAQIAAVSNRSSFCSTLRRFLIAEEFNRVQTLTTLLAVSIRHLAATPFPESSQTATAL